MSVHILTSGYWPTYPILEAKLPEELTQYQSVFKEFYLSKHSGRRLVWHNSQGHCTVRAQFPKGAKELSVSLFQVRRSLCRLDECCRQRNSRTIPLGRSPSSRCALFVQA